MSHVLEVGVIVGVEPRLIKLRSTSCSLIFDHRRSLSADFKALFAFVRVMKELIECPLDLVLPPDLRESVRCPLGQVLRL